MNNLPAAAAGNEAEDSPRAPATAAQVTAVLLMVAALYLGRAIFAFGLILGLGFLLMVSMLFSAAVGALQTWWSPSLNGWDMLLGALNAVSGFALVTLLFAMIYKVMPRVHSAWSDVWVDAVITAVLFTLERVLIGAYLSSGAVGTGFGAAGSLVAVLVWVYYSAQIFFLGADFTWAFARAVGSHRTTGPSGLP
jgi:membrane protein